jgi:hypothetical protein
MRSEVIGDPKIKNHWPSGQPKVEIRKDGPQRRLCAHFVAPVSVGRRSPQALSL